MFKSQQNQKRAHSMMRNYLPDKQKTIDIDNDRIMYKSNLNDAYTDSV